MKKVFVLLTVAVCATSVFAIDMSVGGNLDFTHAWTSGKLSVGTMNQKVKASTNLPGVNAFFDAQYVRVGLGVNFSVGGFKLTSSGDFDKILQIQDTIKEMQRFGAKISTVNFNISLLGKYPFKLGVATIYPMAGFDFSFNVSEKHDGEDLKKSMSDEEKKGLNRYYFVAGLGSDINITDKIFLTPTALFGIAMNKLPMNDTIKEIVKNGGSYKENSFKFNFGLGIGYKF